MLRDPDKTTRRRQTVIVCQRTGYEQRGGCEDASEADVAGETYRPAESFLGSAELESNRLHAPILRGGNPREEGDGSNPVPRIAQHEVSHDTISYGADDTSGQIAPTQNRDLRVAEKKVNDSPDSGIAVKTQVSTYVLAICDAYKCRLELALSNPRGVRASLCAIRRFMEFTHLRRWGHVTTRQVQDFLSSRRVHGAALRTIRNDLSAIVQWCDHLVDEHFLERNPARRVKLQSPGDPMPYYLTQDEMAEVLEVAEAHHLWPEVALALATGLRASELRYLQWRTVDIEARTVHVRGKRKKVRQVPLSALAVEALLCQRILSRDRPYVFAGWRCSRRKSELTDKPRALHWWAYRGLAPVVNACPPFARVPKGQTGRGWHMFRHTFASHLVQANVRIYKVAQWLGHSTVHTTRLYAHLAPGYDEDIELVGQTVKKVAREMG